MLYLIVLSDNTDIPAILDHVSEDPRPNENENTEPSATANKKKSDWGSTTSTTAKLLLHGVRDSADAFGPLKSVAGGLCFILENCEVWLLFLYALPCLQLPQRTKANKQAIESLVPHVEALAQSLCAPVAEEDIKERVRRKRLEQYAHTLQC